MDHYLTKQHQDCLLEAVRQMKSQLLGSEVDTNIPRTTPAGTTDLDADHFQKLHETLKILSDGVQTLNDDRQRFNNESLQSQIIPQTFAQETMSLVESVIPNRNILKQDLSSLKEKIDELQYISYDGSFVWKITNFKEKMSKRKTKHNLKDKNRM